MGPVGFGWVWLGSVGARVCVRLARRVEFRHLRAPIMAPACASHLAFVNRRTQQGQVALGCWRDRNESEPTNDNNGAPTTRLMLIEKLISDSLARLRRALANGRKLEAGDRQPISAGQAAPLGAGPQLAPGCMVMRAPASRPRLGAAALGASPWRFSSKNSPD